MTGWQLVTLLSALFNTAAIVYWQRANETRLDIHWERHKQQEEFNKKMLPMLEQAIAHLLEWDRWRDSEWQEIVNASAVLLSEQNEGNEHPAMKTLRLLKADRLRQSFFLAGRCAGCGFLVDLTKTAHCTRCGTVFPTAMPELRSG